MSAAKHTPGPWVVARQVGGALVVRPEDKRRGEIASLTDSDALVKGEWGQKDFANAANNAHLIAAAPDLLHELMLLNLNENGEQKRNTPAWRAIAKATGDAS